MTLQMDALPMPMAMDASGSIRLGGTRITLDDLMWHFDAGETPEEIVEQLDVLNLADVYLIRGYCLRYTDEVREYLRVRSEMAKRIRERVEAVQGPSDAFVDAILARARSSSGS